MLNNIFALTFLLISASYQLGPILIKGIPGCNPNRICELNGLDDVVANSGNLQYLMSMLNNNGIEAAAVGGWNDHVSYDAVLRSNGALAPYESYTNTANHAFCIEKGNGCNRIKRGGWVHTKPCPPEPCPVPRPQPYLPVQPLPPVQPCPEPYPLIRPCPPLRPYSQIRPCPIIPLSKPYRYKRGRNPCDFKKKKKHCSLKKLKCDNSSYSSDSFSDSCSDIDGRYSSSCSSYISCSDKLKDRCPKYVKQERKIYKNHDGKKKCEDRVNFAVEDIKIVKTFVFNSRDLRNRRSVKFREITDKATECSKWVELKPIFDGCKITKEGYPALLRFPCFLYELKNYIACEYEYPNVCLYLDCEGKLYVRIRDKLYSVNFNRSVKFTKKAAFKHMKLCPVKGRKLNCLIQSGLAGVLFEEHERC